MARTPSTMLELGAPAPAPAFALPEPRKIQAPAGGMRNTGRGEA